MHALVIIPAYNEAGHIAKVVEGVRALDLPCLVLDDGSTDGTSEVAKNAGAEVSTSRRNLGLGPTMRRGYQEAIDRGAEIIVQLDADGQYDPGEIPKLLAPVESGQADMVLGSRMEHLQYKMPWLKSAGNRAFSWVLRRLTKADVRDGQTGFRAIHRTVLERCLPTNDFTYTQEMIIRVAKEGFKIQSVPTKFYARYDDQSRLFHSPVDFAFKAWWIIIRTWRDYHPFRFFFWPGAALILTSFIWGGLVLDHVITTGTIQGKLGSATAAGVTFLFGVQLAFMGVLADMIRTHTRA